MRGFGVKVVLGVLAVGLTAAVAVGVSGTANAVNAAYPGKPGRIAFVSKGDIYTVKPNAAGLTRLTSDGRASGPRWSPDGKRIAYLDAGDLWVMNADGSHKARLTSAAPAFADSRPTWSPNGQYLAFVKTARHAAFGYLTRYNLTSKVQVGYTDTINGKQVRVAALPAPVAWTHATNNGFYIAFEGAAAQCGSPFRYCLDLLGLTKQTQFVNGFPSLEWGHKVAARYTAPDWYPIRTLFSVDIMVTDENCPAKCAVAGTEVRLATFLPSIYEAVWAPDGRHIAYVANVAGVPRIYTVPATVEGPNGTPVPLVKGTEPDWQPLPL